MKKYIPCLIGPLKTSGYKCISNDPNSFGKVLGFIYHHYREGGTKGAWWFETPEVKGYGSIRTRNEAYESLVQLHKQGCT